MHGRQRVVDIVPTGDVYELRLEPSAASSSAVPPAIRARRVVLAVLKLPLSAHHLPLLLLHLLQLRLRLLELRLPAPVHAA